MNKEQQEKLAQVLLDESVICAERGDNDDAKALMMRSVEISFQDKIRRMIDGDFKLFDIQFLTPHLASMGGIEISRDNYLEQLNECIYLENKFPQIDTSNDDDWAVLKNYLHEIKNIS